MLKCSIGQTLQRGYGFNFLGVYIDNTDYLWLVSSPDLACGFWGPD